MSLENPGFVGSLKPNGDSSLGSPVFENNKFDLSSFDFAPTGMFMNSVGSRVYFVGDVSNGIFQLNLSKAGDINSSVDSGNSFASLDEIGTQDVFLTPDGTSLFLVGSVEHTVFEYSLPNPGELTGGITLVNQYLVAEDLSLRGIVFSPDGLKMYLVGDQNNKIFQYTLDFAYDITPANVTLDGSFALDAANANPQHMAWSSDGSKFYVTDVTANKIFQYIPTTNFVVIGATFNNMTIDTSGSGAQIDSSPEGIFINPAFGKIYLVGSSNDNLNQLEIKRVPDISRVGADVFNFDTTSDIVAAIIFSSGGEFYYEADFDIVEDEFQVRQYTLSTPFDPSTKNSGVNVKLEAMVLEAEAIRFSPNGDKFFALNQIGEIHVWDIPVNYDLTSAVFSSNTLFTAQDSTPTDFVLSPDGQTLLLLGNQNNTLYEYFLSTPYDPTIAVYTGDSKALNGPVNPQAMFISVNGNRLIVVDGGSSNEKLYQYNLPLGYRLAFMEDSITNTNVGAGNGGLGMYVSNNFDKLWRLTDEVSGDNKVYEYDISNSPDISQIFLNDKELDIAGNDPRAGRYSKDGKFLYVISQGIGALVQYELDISYQIRTGKEIAQLDLTTDIPFAQGMDITEDGTHIYITNKSGAAPRAFQYDLTIPHDLSTATLNPSSLIINENTDGITMSQDGTMFFTCNVTNSNFIEYEVSTPFEISTGSLSGIDTILPVSTNLALAKSGNQLILVTETTVNVEQWNMTIKNSLLSTSVVSDSFAVAGNPDIQGVDIGFTNQYMILTDFTNDEILQYEVNS